MGILSKLKKEEKSLISSYPDASQEAHMLKASLSYLKNELDKFKDSPLIVCDVKKVIGKKVVIRMPNGNNFLVNTLSNLKLNIGDVVLAEQKSLTVVDKLEDIKNYDSHTFLTLEKPNVKWDDIGGLNEQINEVREVIELPLKRPDLFKKIGIDPLKGVLLHGPPGTGKTLLAKAVASSTNSTFIEVVGSELIQKFIGEGAKLVKEIFKLAREKSPSIIFIDEIDALAAERVDMGTSGEREVQRTFMQFLAELDGFKSLDNVKVIAATNRLDIIDPALLRPGRFDRLIEFSLPDRNGRQHIFNIHTKGMSLGILDKDILLGRTDNFSGADIKSVCTEAGYFAIRNGKDKVIMDDFMRAIDKVSQECEDENLAMYG